jgi:hypothetical protein
MIGQVTMIRHIIFIFLLVIASPLFSQSGASSPIATETITILNDSPASKVYLNGVLIGVGNVNRHPVDPGAYVITVKLDGDVRYTSSITVAVGENALVNTNHFVDIDKNSKISDYGAKQLEEQRLKKSTRGNIGIGGQFNTLASGISIRFQPIERFGVQAIGWAGKGKDDTHHNIHGRVYYELQDTLLGLDNLGIVYCGVGVGSMRTSKEDARPVPMSDVRVVQRNITEAFIGMEFLTWSNIYVLLEVGGRRIAKETKTYADFSSKNNHFETTISLGGHLYFN